jgi:hypothetical protein
MLFQHGNPDVTFTAVAAPLSRLRAGVRTRSERVGGGNTKVPLTLCWRKADSNSQSQEMWRPYRHVILNHRTAVR